MADRIRKDIPTWEWEVVRSQERPQNNNRELRKQFSVDAHWAISSTGALSHIII